MSKKSKKKNTMSYKKNEKEKKEICWPLVVNITLIVMISVMVILTVYYVIVYGFMGKRREELQAMQPTRKPSPTVTLVPEPTDAAVTIVPGTPAVTGEAEPTSAPTETSAPEPTNMPEGSEAPEPTKAPAGTVVPAPTGAGETPVPTKTPSADAQGTATPAPTAMATATPVPSPTARPVPTSTPTPAPTSTPTPTPTPVVLEDMGMEVEATYQVGDNVWFKYYKDSTLLVVTGTGSTWDYEQNHVWDLFDMDNRRFDFVETIIIEEGVTRIGEYALEFMISASRVVIPDSLKTVDDYAFHLAGAAYSGTTVWENLDLSKLKTKPHSFLGANGIEHIAGGAEVMCTPTPTPTPSPTPTPNPEQPRMMHEWQMHDDITMEYWDNGYIYLKGTGDMRNRPKDMITPSDSHDEILKFFKNDVQEELFTKFIVEEGVQGIDNGFMMFYAPCITEFWLPSTMDLTTIRTYEAKQDADFTWIELGDVVHGYYNGKPVTMTFCVNTYAQLQVEAKGLTYTGEGRYYMPEICDILSGLPQEGFVTYTPEPSYGSSMSSRAGSNLVIEIEWK